MKGGWLGQARMACSCFSKFIIAGSVISCSLCVLLFVLLSGCLPLQGEVESMVAAADVNGDGAVDFSEFVAATLGKSHTGKHAHSHHCGVVLVVRPSCLALLCWQL